MNISEIKNILNTNIGNYHAFTFSDLRHVFGGALPLCLYSVLSLVEGRKDLPRFPSSGRASETENATPIRVFHPSACYNCVFLSLLHSLPRASKFGKLFETESNAITFQNWWSKNELSVNKTKCNLATYFTIPVKLEL